MSRPDRLFPTVHIGGTNGKGSVSTLVAASLRRAGWRTALYTSPHLVSFRERYLVDGVPISERAVAMWVDRLRSLIESTDATFFEVGTALAFADFAARGAEIAVIEVGLGGRLDSTNVVRPLVSAVTKIELDHQKYLGDTLEKIAEEKAGIAKPGAPLIVGETRPDLIEVLRRSAGESVRRLDARARADVRVVPPEAVWRGELRLAGAHQRRNAAIADAVLAALPSPWRPDPEAIRRAFAEATIPGRLDRRGRWLFDVAHNPDGMRALVAALATLSVPGPVHALVSILGDKAWPEMLVELDRGIAKGVLTIAPSADTRRWDLDWLRRWLKDPLRPPAQAEWHLVPDFREALAKVQEGAGTVVVTGSFHTVGDVLQALGLSPV
jgi:dihydrofolate synthase/folylpolyglutamate synthase